VTTDDLVKLKQEGVSETGAAAMVSKGSVSGAPAQVVVVPGDWPTHRERLRAPDRSQPGTQTILWFRTIRGYGSTPKTGMRSRR